MKVRSTGRITYPWTSKLQGNIEFRSTQSHNFTFLAVHLSFYPFPNPRRGVSTPRSQVTLTDTSISFVVVQIKVLYQTCLPTTYFASKFFSKVSRFMNWLPSRHRQYWFVYNNTLRTGEADLRFYITTVQDGWRKSAFLIRACFPCTIHLIMQYIEPVSEWPCWRIFVETWPHSELNFRHCASSI